MARREPDGSTAFIDGLGAKPDAFTQRPGTGAPPLLTLRLTAGK